MTSLLKNIRQYIGWGQTKEHRKRSERVLCEDFLKALYNLHLACSTTDLLTEVCEQAHISSEKLPEVIGRLVLEQLIETNPLRLTPQGKQKALSLVRAHRIYEKYLAEHSGYAPEEWHSKAEEMEHKLGIDEKARITSLLRNPLWDPHGDPIPTEDYHIPEVKRKLVSQTKEGDWYKVLHIEDDDEDLFRLLTAEGLANNSVIQMIGRQGKEINIFFEGTMRTLPLESLRSLNLTQLEQTSQEVELARQVKRLTELKPGEYATIAALSPACIGAMRRRLMDLGFVRGSSISIDMRSPMGNPTAYVVRQTAIALRADQARYILIKDIHTEA